MAEQNIRFYGANWCPDCRRSKAFLGEHRIKYEYFDIDQDTEAQEYVKSQNDNKLIIPTILFGDGSILVEPSDAELAEKLGLQTKASKNFYDLIIAGSGPAGLTAALYSAREGIDTLMVDRSAVGGQAGTTELIENYPGFPDSIGGAELTQRMKEQAVNFGVEILQAQNVTEVGLDGQYRFIKTASGDQYQAKAILLALGSTYRRLNVPGEDDFIGAGIHFCATCDGPFYRNKEVLVVGGGNSGLQESLFLTRFVKKITILERNGRLAGSQVLQDKVAEQGQIEVRLNSTVEEFKGNGKLSSVAVKDLKSEKVEVMDTDGVFVFIGLQPNTGFLKGSVDLDQWGFVTTDKTLQTSVPGIFAAGDVREGSTKQIASATGEGATAALMIRQYLEEQ